MSSSEKSSYRCSGQLAVPVDGLSGDVSWVGKHFAPKSRVSNHAKTVEPERAVYSESPSYESESASTAYASSKTVERCGGRDSELPTACSNSAQRGSVDSDLSRASTACSYVSRICAQLSTKEKRWSAPAVLEDADDVPQPVEDLDDFLYDVQERHRAATWNSEMDASEGSCSPFDSPRSPARVRRWKSEFSTLGSEFDNNVSKVLQRRRGSAGKSFTLRLSPISMESLPSMDGRGRATLESQPKLEVNDALDQAPQHLMHEKVLEEYDQFKKVGMGSTSIVYRAVRKCSGQEVILKAMRKKDPEMAEVAEHEYNLLRSLQHPNIIGAVDFVRSPLCLAMVMEFFDSSTLKETCRSAPGCCLAEPNALHLFTQLVSALAHIHVQGLVHRDVKPENMLVSKDRQRLKIIDFNTARYLREGVALTPTGTREFLAPEVLCDKPWSEASDLWAAGLCLCFMLRGRLPRITGETLIGDQQDQHEEYQKVVYRLSGCSTVTTAISNKLLRQCLRVVPGERGTAAQIVEGMAEPTAEAPKA